MPPLETRDPVRIATGPVMAVKDADAPKVTLDAVAMTRWPVAVADSGVISSGDAESAPVMLVMLALME